MIFCAILTLTFRSVIANEFLRSYAQRSHIINTPSVTFLHVFFCQVFQDGGTIKLSSEMQITLANLSVFWYFSNVVSCASVTAPAEQHLSSHAGTPIRSGIHPFDAVRTQRCHKPTDYRARRGKKHDRFGRGRLP